MRDASERDAASVPAFDPALHQSDVGRRRPLTGGGMRRWAVQVGSGEERVEADEVEITAAGVLSFYRHPARRDGERTLLAAWSPSAWWRCRLEGDR